MRDLNERLAKAKEQSAHSTLAWPSLVDDDDERGDEQRQQLLPATHGSALVESEKHESHGSLSSVSVEVPTPISTSTPSSKTAKETSVTVDDL